jgi:hypothetical protein
VTTNDDRNEASRSTYKVGRFVSARRRPHHQSIDFVRVDHRKILLKCCEKQIKDESQTMIALLFIVLPVTLEILPPNSYCFVRVTS